MHFERHFCQEKNIKRKYYVPTLPKIFKPFIRNTLIFYLALVLSELKLQLCTTGSHGACIICSIQKSPQKFPNVCNCYSN